MTYSSHPAPCVCVGWHLACLLSLVASLLAYLAYLCHVHPLLAFLCYLALLVVWRGLRLSCLMAIASADLSAPSYLFLSQLLYPYLACP